MPESKYHSALHWFAVITAIAALILIALGGLVTSKGVGMAVPDWPNTYGYNMFFFPVSQWVGGIFYEHTHRLVASTVGLLTSILALWLHGRNARKPMWWLGLILFFLGVLTLITVPHRWTDALVLGVTGLTLAGASKVWPDCDPAARWLRRLGLAAFLAVVVQGVLGGLRVTAIKDELGIFHGTLAQLFFALLCALALFTSRRWQESRTGDPKQPFRSARPDGFFMAATGLIFLQLVIGATMRHQHAGLAIPDFPGAYGRVWPKTDLAAIEKYNQQRLEVVAVKPITAIQVQLQMAHRLTAVLILVAVTTCAMGAGRKLGWKDPLARLSLTWVGLIFIQVALGAWTIWSNKAADIATAHVIVGTLSLATGIILCILAAYYSGSVGFTGSAVKLSGLNNAVSGRTGSTAETSK
jgi:cytochrome c oxidase assembly protein subunit 15